MVFRTGNKASEFYVSDALQDALGSSISKDRNSYVGIICIALGRQINLLYEDSQRRLNQQFAETMTTDLDKWEEFLGLSDSRASDSKRRKQLDRLFKRFVNKPNMLNIKNYLQDVLGDVFIKVERLEPGLIVNNDANTVGFIPGGLVNDQVNIPDGEMSSALGYVPVRVWNPRNEYDQQKYGVAEFLEIVNSFYNEMDSYLPATNECDWFTFEERCIGTISCLSNSTSVTGIGTVFGSGVEPMVEGEILEVVCDDGIRVDLEVVSQFSDTLMVIKVPPGHAIINKKFRRRGIFVGQDGNLGYAGFH